MNEIVTKSKQIREISHYDFELKQRKQNLKISFQFLMGFHSDWFQRLFFLEWIIATSLSPDCQHRLWLHCVSSKQRQGLLPIYILVIMWQEHYAIYIGFRSKLELQIVYLDACVCAWCCAGLHPKHADFSDWTAWSLGPSFCCIWVIRHAAHKNEIWFQVVLGCRADSMQCSATRSSCNRELRVFGKLKTFLFIQV